MPPDYLKFDMKLVQNLETASVERQRMLASLVQMVHDLGITPLAEGIERPGDHESAGRSVSPAPRASTMATRRCRSIVA